MPPPVEGASTYFLTPEAAQLCASEIAEAGGVEVFFIGRRNEAGLIAEVESHAFGTPDCVPALMNLAKPGDILIHNHPGGNLLPSDADLGIASTMGNMGVGFYIIDDGCTRCRVVVKGQDAKKKIRIDEREVEKRLSPQGNLAKVVDSYEDRPQQREMGLGVAEAFNGDGIAVIEAGTGTGKSFAYLVPAILYRDAERANESWSARTPSTCRSNSCNKDVPALRTCGGRGVRRRDRQGAQQLRLQAQGGLCPHRVGLLIAGGRVYPA
jgi:ATP-dependent DNA helicase DinG